MRSGARSWAASRLRAREVRKLQARLVGALVLLLLLVAPSSLAAWSAKGAFEPDTVYDLGGFMRLQPDVDAKGSAQLVYFNGFGAVGGAAATTLNPNLATLRTSILPAPFLPTALLGVWKDCNRDGFVGMGDNGAMEYRAQLLLDDGVCPPGEVDPERPWARRNDGEWVVEFAPIGYDDIRTAVDENPLTLNDTGARVWADWGLPADAPGAACATVPAPRGTFRSTGGLVGHLDCLLGQRGTAAVNDAAAAAGQPELGFSDAPPGRPWESSSPLNQPNPWGSEGDAPLVRAFDCGTSGTFVVSDPTSGGLDAIADDEGVILTVTTHPVLVSVDPSGSPGGSVNETQAALTDCDRSDTDEMVDLDGRRTGSDGDLPYALEGPTQSTLPGSLRVRTDHVFTFEEGARRDMAGALLGARTREHAGLGTASLTGFWVGTAVAGVARNAFASRHSLGVEPVTYLTYYAHVSDGLVSLHNLLMPSAASSRYGNEGCAAGTFECDPALWWVDDTGADITPRDERLGVDQADPTAPALTPETRIGVRVGQPYRLRDIDCIDTSFAQARALGAQWGLLTQTACARPPS